MTFVERVSAPGAAATPRRDRRPFIVDGVLLATTVSIAVLTTLRIVSPEVMPWCMVWIVLLASALLPSRRAAMQTVAVLVLTAARAVVVGSEASNGYDSDSSVGDWLVVAFTIVLLSAAMRRIIGHIHQRTIVAEAVAQLGQQALGVHKPDQLLAAALRVAVQALQTEYGTALRCLPDGQLVVAAEIGPDSFPTGTVLSLAPTGSYALQVVQSGLPFVSSDLRRDGRITPPSPLIDRGVVSGVAVPLLGAECTLGVLAVHARRVRWFASHEVAVLQALAGVVSTAWEQIALHERLGHQALHDSLTGLPNRALLLDRMGQALSRRNTQIAVALIDLDHFKAINDNVGHAAGDLVLRAVAHRLASAIRPADTLARFGCDEFALICDSVSDEQEAVAIVKGMLAAASLPLVVGEAVLTVTASAGIALSGGERGPATSAEVLMREVDTALDRAKEHGGARAELFDAGMQIREQARLAMKAELRRAIDREELVVHYQPIRSTADQRVIAVEALVRWCHPERGLLPPDVFLPLAEQTGLILPLGRWVLRTACQQAARWQRELRGTPEAALRIAINVSPRQLEDHDLPLQVAEAIEASNLLAGTLSLELTETALLDVSDVEHTALTRLIAAGATLILDDFGTGYSSLTHLARFPIEALKIDRTFTAGLDKDPRDTAIVAAVIALGEELGVDVIAEGVETGHQLEILQRMGCPAVQGFLFDRPRPQPDWEANAAG